LVRPRKFQQSPEALHVVVRLLKLIVIGRVSNGSKMKNCVELFATELFPPIQLRQIGRNKIAAIAAEILEIPGAKVVNRA